MARKSAILQHKPQAQQIARAVTDWTIKKYNLPRKRPKRSREERAATQLVAPAILEAAGEVFGRASVRQAARLSDQSKSTIARHLKAQGVAPRRAKKIATLPAVQKRLLAILESTFPIDGAGIVRADDLAAAVWSSPGNADGKALSRSTKSSRRRKLSELLSKLSDAGLGFHLRLLGDVVAVRRGRRFRDQKEMLVWIEDERRIRGFRPIRLPVAPPKKTAGFWADPYVEDLLAVLNLGIFPHINFMHQIEPLLRLARPLLDEAPLTPWLHRAYNAYSGDFGTNLVKLADRIVDPVVKAAARKIARAVIDIPVYADSRYPDDFFDQVDRLVGLMNRVHHLPETYARFGYIREHFFIAGADEGKELAEIMEDCATARQAEGEGRWQPPDPNVLARYRPENEPPF